MILQTHNCFPEHKDVNLIKIFTIETHFVRNKEKNICIDPRIYQMIELKDWTWELYSVITNKHVETHEPVS